MVGLGLDSLIEKSRADIEYLEKRVYDEMVELEDFWDRCQQMKKRVEKHLLDIIEVKDNFVETFLDRDKLTDEQEEEIERQEKSCDDLYEEADALCRWIGRIDGALREF